MVKNVTLVKRLQWCFTLISDCKLNYSIHQLLDKDWNVVVDHTLRKSNACGDILAKMSANPISPLVKLRGRSSSMSIV
jgi:hypothetical protein